MITGNWVSNWEQQRNVHDFFFLFGVWPELLDTWLCFEKSQWWIPKQRSYMQTANYISYGILVWTTNHQGNLLLFLTPFIDGRQYLSWVLLVHRWGNSSSFGIHGPHPHNYCCKKESLWNSVQENNKHSFSGTLRVGAGVSAHLRRAYSSVGWSHKGLHSWWSLLGQLCFACTWNQRARLGMSFFWKR